MKGCEDVGPWTRRPRAQTMMKSDEVEAMLHLHALGWGFKRIARESGAAITRCDATWRPTVGWPTGDSGPNRSLIPVQTDH